MFPFHLRLGPFAISPVEITVVLGIALAGFLARRRMSPQPSWTGMLDLGLAALLGGAVGARLFYFVPLWIRGKEPGGRLLSDWSQGSGYLGGLVLATVLVLVVARVKKLHLPNVADAVGIYIPLGFASGKLGCFLAGCCYGPRTDGFLGVSFPPGSLVYDVQLAAHEIPAGASRSLPVHPTQLYEFTLGVLLCLSLGLLHRRSRRPGETFLASVAGYSLWRFVIEFFRADPGRHTFGSESLSDSQISSIVLVAVSAVLWILLRTRKPVEAAGPPAPK